MREELEAMAEGSDQFSLWYTLDRSPEGESHDSDHMTDHVIYILSVLSHDSDHMTDHVIYILSVLSHDSDHMTDHVIYIYLVYCMVYTLDRSPEGEIE